MISSEPETRAVGVRSSRGDLRIIVVLVVAAIALGPSCSRGDSRSSPAAPAGSSVSTSTPETVEVASAVIEGAAAALKVRMQTIDSSVSLALIDYLQRGWRIEELGGANEIARRLGPQSIDDEQLWRLVDVSAKPVASLRDAFPSTRVLAMSLHCDEVDLPRTYLGDAMRLATSRGGYEAAHVAMALKWTEELGCALDGRAAALDRLAVDIARQRAETAVDDLALEQTAVLLYVGRRDLVDPGWIADTVASRTADGGWRQGAEDVEAGWHATTLGLWTLLAWTSDPSSPMLLAAA